MKTICISALLGSSFAALECIDERVQSAKTQATRIDEEIREAASLQVKAMTDARDTNAQDLLQYQAVMNTLSVALVSAESYQLAADQGGDRQAKSNAYEQVAASMRAMAYEQGKTGSASIKAILDEIKVATSAVKVAEEKKAKNDQELIIAKNLCVPGQAGTPSPTSAQDEQEFQMQLASIPSQINLKQVIKSDICPGTCQINYETFLPQFENGMQGDQWLEDCINQCDMEQNIIDRDYSTWSNQQERAAIVATVVDENLSTVKSGLDLDTNRMNYLTEEDILNHFQQDPSTVKITFACRTTDAGEVICFDENGQQVNVTLAKDGQTAEQFLRNTPTTQSGIECTLYDTMFGMCTSAVRSVGSYSAAMMAMGASIVYISSEQSL